MPRDRTLLTLYALLGAYAVCAQALLLREAQTVLLGSELSWGLILACWLTGVALGSALARRRARTPEAARRLLADAVIILPLCLLATLLFLRGARLLLGTGPGEYPGPGGVLLVALAATLPNGFPVGAAFPAAGAVLAGEVTDRTARARAVGRIYAAEAAGSLIGGALFSFVLITRLDPFTIATGPGALLLAVLMLLLAGDEELRDRRLATCLVATGLAALTVFSLSARLSDRTARWRWSSFAPGLVLAATADSRYQNIALGRLEDEFSLYLNGRVAATWPDPAGYAITAHLAACEHLDPRRMLLLGGGQEGLVRELLRHDPARLELVTLDEEAFALQRRFLAADDLAALRRGPVRVHYGDIRRRVKDLARGTEGRWDLIILQAPEPATALTARFYTGEFFAELRDIMAPDGVLLFTLQGSAEYWGEETAAYVAAIVEPLATVFPEVLITFGTPTCVFATGQGGVLTGSGEELARRYRLRGVDSPAFDPLWFAGGSDLLDPAKRAALREALRTHSPRHVNTDARPVATLHHLRLRLATTGAAHFAERAPPVRGKGLVGRLLDLRTGPVAAAVVLLTLAAGLIAARRGREAAAHLALLWSTAAVGCAGMATELILLYTFQVLYGYVYQMIGLIVGVFMAGLVAGSLLMNRFLPALAPESSGDETADASDRRGTTGRSGADEGNDLPSRTDRGPAERRGLAGIAALDLAVALFAVALALILPRLRSPAAPDLPAELAIFLLVALAGVLGGCLFPLATHVRLGTGRGTAEAAGAVSVADHLGGAAGALLTGAVLVPVLGTDAVCAVLAVTLAAAAGLTASGILRN